MYFDLTQDQKAIGEEVASLLRDSLPEDRLVPRFDACDIDRELFEKLSAMGLGGVLAPESEGGLELGLLTLAVIADAIGASGAAVPVIDNALAAWVIAAAGSQAQRSRWLPGLIDGSLVAAFALAEPDGWQPADWRLTGPVLDGVKPYVVWGEQADLLIVGLADAKLALIDPTAEGVTRSAIDPVDRNRPMAEIGFAGVAADPLGGDPETADKLCDAMFVLLAADACGAGLRMVEMAVDYAKVRTQFDQPIGAFQALKHQLADMTAQMQPCRPLCWYAAHAWDAIPDRRGYAASLAKAHVGDVAVSVARRTVEAHGGIGYTWEYPLHVFLKRTMFDREAMGLPALHRARAAALAGW